MSLDAREFHEHCAMSPSTSQAERWLAKAGERSGANVNAPSSVNSRRSGDPDNYGNQSSFADEYRAPRAARYAAADSEVRQGWRGVRGRTNEDTHLEHRRHKTRARCYSTQPRNLAEALVPILCE